MTLRSLKEIAEEVTPLQERAAGSNGIISHLHKAEGYLEEARILLRAFPSDPAAERALEHTSMSIDHSRNASIGSLNDFVGTSIELQTRLLQS